MVTDSDAITRIMETEAEWHRRTEDLFDETDGLEQKPWRYNFERRQQVNLKILEALQDLKSAK